MTPQPIRAAIYLRISLDREMDGLAIERQREDCEKIAALRGWPIVDTYVDQSLSATDRSKVRPEYNRMVADFEAGRFNAIICWDLDRLTRQPIQLEQWVAAAETKGLLLVTANGDADLATDSGRLFARIKAAVARAEMERKSARQSRAQRQRAELGRPPKGMRPLGYAVDGSVIEEEAATVRAIYAGFTRADQPESLRSLARALSGLSSAPGIVPRPKHSHTVSRERAAARQAQGLPPRPIMEDGAWSPSTVLGILRNPRYGGFSTYTPKTLSKTLPNGEEGKRRGWRAQIVRDETGEPIRGAWQQIVDDETWWRAQSLLDDVNRVTNTSGSTKRKRLGSGLYICGVCGKRVGSAPRGYGCPGHLLRTGLAIDDYVTRTIARRLVKPDAMKHVIAASKTPATEGLDVMIGEQRARIERAQNDYDEELIEARDLKRVREAALARIEDLEGQRLMQGNTAVLVPILGTDSPAAAFLDASTSIKREVIDTFAVIRLLPNPQGKKGFDPASVDFTWRIPD